MGWAGETYVNYPLVEEQSLLKNKLVFDLQGWVLTLLNSVVIL